MLYKFRVWNRFDKVMIDEPHSMRLVAGEMKSSEDDILMQFTGLTDKNGVEIFADDVLSMWYAPQATAKGVVLFDNGCFVFSTTEATPSKCPLFSIEEYGNYIEVIGNIHQHPELMEPDHE